MADRSVTHATFLLERSYDASPARVFAAWADPAAKARWFAGPEEGTGELLDALGASLAREPADRR